MEAKKIKSIIHDSNNQLQVIQSLLFLNKQQLGSHYKRISGMISSLSNKNFTIGYYVKGNFKYKLTTIQIGQFRKEITHLINRMDEVYFPVITEAELTPADKQIKYNKKLVECIICNIFELNSKNSATNLIFNYSMNKNNLKLEFKSLLQEDILPSEEDILLIQDMCKKCGFHFEFKNMDEKQISVLIKVPFID